MDDDAVADDASRTRPLRWRPALVTAVCLVLVGVVAVVIITRSYGRSAVPAPAGSPPGGVLITGSGMLLQTPGHDVTLCVGLVLTSSPPKCGGPTIALAGLEWDDVPGATTQSGTTSAAVTLTGWWAGDVLQVTNVTAPQPPVGQAGVDVPGQLCTDPDGTGATALDQGPDQSALEALEGFQGLWITYPDGPPADGPTAAGTTATTVVNVAVLHDVAHATEVIRKSYTGPLCVGTLPGVSLRAAMDAADRLRDRVGELDLVGFGPSLLGGRSGLGVDVFLATEDTVARILDVIGPDVAAYTTVTGQFHVVE